VYRIVTAYREHARDEWFDTAPAQVSWLAPSPRRSLLALLKKVPSAYGWRRTRGSCATLAAQLKSQRGIEGSASTLRRGLHREGWVWKRAQLVARDDAPERIEKLARIRHIHATPGKREVLLFAAELDRHLLPKVGYQWMPQGATVKLGTPGQNQQHSRAGALEPPTGRLVHGLGSPKTNVLFRALLDRLAEHFTKARFAKVYVVVDNYGLHQAKAVARWLAEHPRFPLLFLPPYCPQATPLERAFGAVHDQGTRNHQRTRSEEVVGEVEQHGPTGGKLR
jgi:transposase